MAGVQERSAEALFGEFSTFDEDEGVRAPSRLALAIPERRSTKGPRRLWQKGPGREVAEHLSGRCF